tara:strand:- start:2042 stop:2185 length:144 start_codon:yes stop_codon:yes gene_type:complete
MQNKKNARAAMNAATDGTRKIQNQQSERCKRRKNIVVKLEVSQIIKA